MKTHSVSVCLCAVFLLLCLLISCGGQKDPVGTEADRTLPVSDSGTEKDTAKDLPESTTGAAQTESSAATEEKTAQPDPEETTADGETTGDEEATGTGSLENPPTPNAEMPVISITTDGGRGISTSDAYTVCTVSLQGCNAMYDIGERSAGIRVRGNSTAVADKKPYRLRFDKKVNLLGLNRGAKCKNWVLLADYYDPSLMRSETAFRVAKTILGGTVFSSDYIHVEVYINGKYNGVYLLCEQTQINKHRVGITEREDESYAGLDIGYLMVGQGGRTNEANTLHFPGATALLTDVYGTEIEAGLGYFALASGDYTEEQIAYISEWVSAVYRLTYEAIYNDNYYSLDPVTCQLTPLTDFAPGMTAAQKQKETIGRVMNLDSAVRMYLLDEVVKDLDSSTFNMYVDMGAGGDKKLTFGAPWDFDFALGNTRWKELRSPSGLYACSFLETDGIRQNSWYVMMYHAEWFRDDVKARWAEIYMELRADAEEIRKEAKLYADAFDRNDGRWKTIGKITMGWHQNKEIQNFETHMDAAEQLYTWLITRLRWLNTEWGDGKEAEKEVSRRFLMKDCADAFINFKRCGGQLAGDAYMLYIDGDHDPYVTFDVERLASLSADLYTTLEITYRIPKDSAQKSYETEIFLMSGDVTSPTGGISVKFRAIADGKQHTAILDLTEQPSWSGTIHGIRIDFFPDASHPDDIYELFAIEFRGYSFE